jgi:uncharacterized Zn-binding protein involved in type VI secretion
MMNSFILATIQKKLDRCIPKASSTVLAAGALAAASGGLATCGAGSSQRLSAAQAALATRKLLMPSW